MLRLIFWLLLGDRRPLLEDVRHLSTPILRRATTTVLLHATRKEDYILVQSMSQVIIERFDARNKQPQNAPQDNVRQHPSSNQQQSSNPNNTRR